MGEPEPAVGVPLEKSVFRGVGVYDCTSLVERPVAGAFQCVQNVGSVLFEPP